MKTAHQHLIKLSFVLLASVLCLPTFAQQVKIVSGRITDKETKKPFSNEAVFIYAYNTIAAAEDAKKLIDESNGTLTADGEAVADAGGNYEIKVAENGALIYKVGIAPCVIERVNFRMEINISIDAGIVLEMVSIVGTLQDISPKEQAPTMIGNMLMMRNTFPIPAQFGKTNARLIIQPYVVECSKQDTIAFARPLVYDGEQYKLTQERRMGYNLKHDPLAQYVDSVPLTENRMNIEWQDTIIVPDPTLNYFSNAVILLEDYNQAYYNKTTKIISCEARRPLKFLEYSLSQYELDPNQYIRKPKRELRNTATNISLTFLVGKAEIDPNDPENAAQMNKLKDDLIAIIECEDCKLKEIQVTGVSSPEGAYGSNFALAQRRAGFAKEQISNLLPQRALSRVFMPAPNSKVSSWLELSDILEKDTLPTEAAEIRKMVEANPKSQDAQFATIKNLPYYPTTIKEHLPALRYMRFEYKHEIFRELTPEEILYRYKNDPDYHNGRKAFALYEYWHLFRMVKDPKELEALYRRAYKESEQLEGQPWILPANLLATSYLRRDTVDTSILEPFIDRKTRNANVERTRMDGVTKEIINPEAVIANQLSMYLKANNFEQASVMAQILPNTEQNARLKAFAMCLGGYYRGGNTPAEREEAKQTFNLVKSSSPLNEVIMYLAMDSRGYDVMAQRATENLPKDDPKAWYLKAIIQNRNGEMGFEAAKNCLVKCFSLNESYIRTAEMDGDIGKDLFEYAMDMYPSDKEMIDMLIQQYKL